MNRKLAAILLGAIPLSILVLDKAEKNKKVKPTDEEEEARSKIIKENAKKNRDDFISAISNEIKKRDDFISSIADEIKKRNKNLPAEEVKEEVQNG